MDSCFSTSQQLGLFQLLSPNLTSGQNNVPELYRLPSRLSPYKQTSSELPLQATLHFPVKKKRKKETSNIWSQSPLECIFLPLFMDEKQNHVYGEEGAAP